MNIAFVGSEGVPYPAAFASITEEVGARLVDRGHGVTVYGRRRLVPDASPYRGMARVPVRSWNSKHLDTITFSGASLLHALWAGWADVVHIHGVGPAPLAWLPRIRHARVVVHVHGMDAERAKWNRFARSYLRLSAAAAVRLPDATVAVSRILTQSLEQRYGRKVHHVPQGVTAGVPVPPTDIRALGIEPGKYLLFMARLVPEKGLHYLLEAHAALSTSRADVPMLVVAGASAHSDSYVDRVRAAAGDNVRFVGHVDGALKQQLLSHALLFVQPSEIEGLSLTLLEAMSYGRPVISSDIPENLEALAGSGFTFRSRDVTDLVRTISAALDRRNDLPAIGEAARHRTISTYSWDSVADALERVYDEVVPGARTRALQPHPKKGEPDANG